jgi:MFS family permease
MQVSASRYGWARYNRFQSQARHCTATAAGQPRTGTRRKALPLFAGALGDKYGRKKIFQSGVAWFAVASLPCASAPRC